MTNQLSSAPNAEVTPTRSRPIENYPQQIFKQSYGHNHHANPSAHRIQATGQPWEVTQQTSVPHGTTPADAQQFTEGNNFNGIKLGELIQTTGQPWEVTQQTSTPQPIFMQSYGPNSHASKKFFPCGKFISSKFSRNHVASIITSLQLSIAAPSDLVSF